MTDIARLDYMVNENELYVIRPRENSISKPVLIRDICRRCIILFIWCTIGHISTGVEYRT